MALRSLHFVPLFFTPASWAGPFGWGQRIFLILAELPEDFLYTNCTFCVTLFMCVYIFWQQVEFLGVCLHTTGFSKKGILLYNSLADQEEHAEEETKKGGETSKEKRRKEKGRGGRITFEEGCTSYRNMNN